MIQWLQHRPYIYVNGTRVGERGREQHGGKEGAREEKDKDRRKARISTIFFPLISSVYNIKAITCCLCQRVRNNTLVTEEEMR